MKNEKVMSKAGVVVTVVDERDVDNTMYTIQLIRDDSDDAQNQFFIRHNMGEAWEENYDYDSIDAFLIYWDGKKSK